LAAIPPQSRSAREAQARPRIILLHFIRGSHLRRDFAIFPVPTTFPKKSAWPEVQLHLPNPKFSNICIILNPSAPLPCLEFRPSYGPTQAKTEPEGSFLVLASFLLLENHNHLKDNIKE